MPTRPHLIPQALRQRCAQRAEGPTCVPVSRRAAARTSSWQRLPATADTAGDTLCTHEKRGREGAVLPLKEGSRVFTSSCHCKYFCCPSLLLMNSSNLI